MMRLPAIAVLTLLALFFIGCTNAPPPEVQAASKAQGDLLESYKADMIAVLDAYALDYEQAVYSHIDTILDYELKARAEGDMIALEKVQELIALYRSKNTEMKERIAAVKIKIASAHTTLEQAIILQRSITSYLSRRHLEPEDLKALIDDIKNTFSKGE